MFTRPEGNADRWGCGFYFWADQLISRQSRENRGPRRRIFRLAGEKAAWFDGLGTPPLGGKLLAPFYKILRKGPGMRVVSSGPPW